MTDPTIIEVAARALAECGFYDNEATAAAKTMLAAVTPLIEAAALERAAQVAHDHGRYSQAYLDGDLPDDVVIHNHACWAIRDKLRALKETRPWKNHSSW